MNKDLIEAARKRFAENLFDLVMRSYCEANKEYLQKQINIAAEYLTEEQKAELRKLGVNVL